MTLCVYMLRVYSIYAFLSYLCVIKYFHVLLTETWEENGESLGIDCDRDRCPAECAIEGCLVSYAPKNTMHWWNIDLGPGQEKSKCRLHPYSGSTWIRVTGDEGKIGPATSLFSCFKRDHVWWLISINLALFLLTGLQTDLSGKYFSYHSALCRLTVVAKNGDKWLHIIAKNGNKRIDLLLYERTSVTFLPFLAIFCISVSNNARQKLPIFIDLKVAKNGKWT